MRSKARLSSIQHLLSGNFEMVYPVLSRESNRLMVSPTFMLSQVFAVNDCIVVMAIDDGVMVSWS